MLEQDVGIAALENGAEATHENGVGEPLEHLGFVPELAKSARPRPGLAAGSSPPRGRTADRPRRGIPRRLPPPRRSRTHRPSAIGVPTSRFQLGCSGFRASGAPTSGLAAASRPAAGSDKRERKGQGKSSPPAGLVWPDSSAKGAGLRSTWIACCEARDRQSRESSTVYQQKPLK